MAHGLCTSFASEPTLKSSSLLTTFNEEFDRVAMHAVQRELVEA